MSSTQITIAGNLAEAPELRYTPTGKSTARMRVAVTDRRQTQAGEWVDGQTSWHTVICWGKLAEHAAETLTKGARVLVHGRIAQRDYETKEGEKRTSWEITAEEIGAALRYGLPTQGGGLRPRGTNRSTTSPRPPDLLPAGRRDRQPPTLAALSLRARSPTHDPRRGGQVR